jgi:hypothetical protein
MFHVEHYDDLPRICVMFHVEHFSPAFSTQGQIARMFHVEHFSETNSVESSAQIEPNALLIQPNARFQWLH